MKDVLICIDAGHGKHTAGKRCWKALDPAETREWELNRRVAEALERRLADCPCRVLRADDRTGAVDVPLSQRVQRANRAGAAVYLSIHHNAGVGGGPGGGIVVFSAPGASSRARALRDRVYARTVARTGLRGNRAQPLGESGYYVLRKTAMPAVLGEFGFMDSRTDVPVILSGGQGPGEAITEAECMRRALVRRGADESRLYPEERSTSTQENLRYSRAILEELGVDPARRVAIVTSDFHLCRARLMWDGDTAAVPAHLPSALYFQCLTVNYFIREAFGLAAYFVYGG